MPENAIFISYAREDLPAVQRLKAALDAAGVTTWFDLDRLEGGDDYDRKIQPTSPAALSSCRSSRRRRSAGIEGYFRREWSYAVDRARNIAEGARVHPAGVHRRHRRRAARSVPEKFKSRAHHAPAGRRGHAGVRAPLSDFLSSRKPCSRAPDASRRDAAHEPRYVARTPTVAAQVAVDPENPWLGLSSYTEETRAYFHGRDDEAAELARRVQRKLLTVLFGQSGLGKTSLLRAGLVPRLRGEGYCPVYVRVDYSPESPPPSEQIKQAIFRATAAAGHWTRPAPPSRASRCGSSCTTAATCCATRRGKTLMPLLIFDQFEEIFTLAQSDDSGRLRAEQFLDDLADLVENRAAQGARGADRRRRGRRRALRLRARRLPHPDRAARGLSRPPRGREGHHALDHAEPDAPRADDRRAGARRGDEARRQARLARKSPSRSCASSPAARSSPTPRSSRRCLASSAAS